MTRWRSGVLVGDVIEAAARLKDVAPHGQVLVTGEAAQQLEGSEELERVPAPEGTTDPDVGELWSLALY